MNTVLDLIYRLLAHPTDAMSDVTTGEKMKESSIIWGFVILLLALSSVEAGSFVTAFLASFVGTGSLLLLHSAVVDYISGLLGGRGTARGITAGFMCASIPYAFSVFFSLSTKFMSVETLSYMFSSSCLVNFCVCRKRKKPPSCKRTKAVSHFVLPPVTAYFICAPSNGGHRLSLMGASPPMSRYTQKAAPFSLQLRSDIQRFPTRSRLPPSPLRFAFL